MKKHQLQAETRTITGRKVKKLRQSNLMPANIFGKHVKSQSVQVPMDKFLKTYQAAGETGLVDLQVGKDIKTILIQNVQTHPLTSKPLHADFYQVDLKEKIHAQVPVVLVGTAQAVEQKLGVMLSLLDKIEVEALPMDLPEKIEVSVVKLAKIGDEIKVGDLTLPSGVTALTGADVGIVRISSLVTKEAEELAKAEAAAAAQAAAASTAAPAAAPGATTEAPPPTAEAKPATGEEVKKPA